MVFHCGSNGSFTLYCCAAMWLLDQQNIISPLLQNPLKCFIGYCQSNTYESLVTTFNLHFRYPSVQLQNLNRINFVWFHLCQSPLWSDDSRFVANHCRLSHLLQKTSQTCDKQDLQSGEARLRLQLWHNKSSDQIQRRSELPLRSIEAKRRQSLKLKNHWDDKIESEISRQNGRLQIGSLSSKNVDAEEAE